jgi:hypothetical protein
VAVQCSRLGEHIDVCGLRCWASIVGAIPVGVVGLRPFASATWHLVGRLRHGPHANAGEVGSSPSVLPSLAPRRVLRWGAQQGEVGVHAPPPCEKRGVIQRLDDGTLVLRLGSDRAHSHSPSSEGRDHRGPLPL